MTLGRKNFFRIGDIIPYVNPDNGVCTVTVEIINLLQTKTLTFKGSSKCHKDDEFNEMIGIDLAQYRAMRKAFTYMRDAIDEMLHDNYVLRANLEVIRNAICRKIDKHTKLLNDEN